MGNYVEECKNSGRDRVDAAGMTGQLNYISSRLSFLRFWGDRELEGFGGIAKTVQCHEKGEIWLVY